MVTSNIHTSNSHTQGLSERAHLLAVTVLLPLVATFATPPRHRADILPPAVMPPVSVPVVAVFLSPARQEPSARFFLCRRCSPLAPLLPHMSHDDDTDDDDTYDDDTDDDDRYDDDT